MILPQTYFQCLLLLILSTLCLGSWAVTFRSAGKWRFELYYLDYAVGVGITALLYGFTTGNLGFDGFGLMDDLMHAGKRQWLFAVTGGIVFNLGNMLIVGAIAVAGMAVAMMLGAGLGIMLGVGISQLMRAGTNTVLLGGSFFLLIAGVIAMTAAYAKVVADRRAAIEAENSGKKFRRGPGPVKGILVSIIGGLLMAASYPLFGRSQGGDIGLGPYTATVLFAAGLAVSTFVFSLFFMNLPLQGEPVELIDYAKAGIKTHLIGLLGGILWCTGFLAAWVTVYAPLEIQPGRFVIYALLLGGPLLGVIWGFAGFREFRSSPRATTYAGLGLLLGLGSLVLALLSSAHVG